MQNVDGWMTSGEMKDGRRQSPERYGVESERWTGRSRSAAALSRSSPNKNSTAHYKPPPLFFVRLWAYINPMLKKLPSRCFHTTGMVVLSLAIVCPVNWLSVRSSTYALSTEGLLVGVATSLKYLRTWSLV